MNSRIVARFFLMRPDREMNGAFGYLLAAYAAKCSILVHAGCVQNFRWHAVLGDPYGLLPVFMLDFNRGLVNFIKAHSLVAESAQTGQNRRSQFPRHQRDQRRRNLEATPRAERTRRQSACAPRPAADGSMQRHSLEVDPKQGSGCGPEAHSRAFTIPAVTLSAHAWDHGGHSKGVPVVATGIHASTIGMV